MAIESDSMLIVCAVKKTMVHYMELGHVFQHSRWLLVDRSTLSLGFVKKLANNVAHKMARLPCELSCCAIYKSLPHIGDTYA